MTSIEEYMATNIIWSTTEVGGHPTYGFFGKDLKNKVESWIRSRWNGDGFREIEGPLVAPNKVWERSGHLGKFQDVFVKTASGRMYRKDTLRTTPDGEPILDDPSDKLLPDVEIRNLMFPTKSHDMDCSLRPETATVSYLSYPFFRGVKKVYQIGKAFRNELQTRGMLRLREFTQAEAQIFTSEHSTEILKETLEKTKIMLESVLPAERLRLVQQNPEDRAFYALDAYDIEVNLPKYGWTEVAGVHDRGKYDLTQHQMNPEYVIEVAIGIDRLIYSLISLYYIHRSKDVGKSVLRLPYHICPIQCSVLPLTRKPDMTGFSKELYRRLSNYFRVVYREKKSIGARYQEDALESVPYSITIDGQTLVDSTVTVRDRDTQEQIRVHDRDLISTLLQRFQ